MGTIEVDVAVIGAGTSGLNARRDALHAGAERVVLIEDGPYGTTCARVGCMPSKLLIAAADRVHEMQTSPPFGVTAGEIEIDGRKVMERVRRERDRFVGFVVGAVEDYPADERIRGRARFVETTRLEVALNAGGTELVDAKSVVIATGSSPWWPSVLNGAGSRLIQNDDVFEFEELPESVLVVGAGVIGLELGQALHRLGVRVTIVTDVGHLGPLTDPDVRAKALAVLGNELDIRTHARIESTDEVEAGVRATWSVNGERSTETFEYVLAATGRRPNLSSLNLEATGLDLDDKGVPLFDGRTAQCGRSPVFIAGDVTGERQLLHEASDEGHIAGENAATFPEVKAHRRRAGLGVVFSDPQIAVVGRSYAALVASGAEFGTGEVSYDNQGRARVMGVDSGLVRLYGARQCGTLLGAEMFGPRVEHTAHLLAWMVQARLELKQVLAMPFYHPVVEEGIRTALRNLASNLKLDHAQDPLCDGPGC